MDSILITVKKKIGVNEEDTSFDTDIITCINTVLSILNQLGVGPEEGLTIKDKTDTWDELTTDPIALAMAESYIPLKVRLMFDPPSSGSVMEAIKMEIAELEWRMNAAVDSGD